MIGEIVVGDVDAPRRQRRSAGRPAAGGTLPRAAGLSDDPGGRRRREAGQPRARCRPASSKEAVTVTTTNIVIRGLDRSGTVLDGEFHCDNGIKVLADGVAVENMTAANYTEQRLLLDRREGLPRLVPRRDPQRRLRHLAFDSTYGQFDHDYGAGQPDAGFHRPVLPVPRGDHATRSPSGTASATPERTPAATCSSCGPIWRDNRVDRARTAAPGS